MRRYIILFFSVLPLLYACSNTPDGILKPKPMAAVLTEIHMVDGAISNIPQIPDSLYKYGTARYLAVFKKFNTDSAQFRRSYKYYTLHPDVLVNIYDMVLKSLQAKTDSLNGLVAKANTAPGKKPLVPTANRGGAIPNATVPPNRPGALNNPNSARAAFERAQAHRDSILKRQSKNHNAVPAK